MNVANSMRRYMSVMVFVLIGAYAVETLAQAVPRPRRRGYKYKVRIDSAPQQSAIYLDDKKYGIVGYTPWSGRLQRGDWVVILEKKGYNPVKRKIRVHRTRRTQTTFVPMVKKVVPAMLDITGTADKNAVNAEVWLDGQLQGNIPILLKVSDGRHLVEIKKKGFKDFSQWSTVKEGDRVSINPVLTALKVVKKGNILVTSDMDPAEVWIDGKKHSQPTPTMITGVTAGIHVVEVKKAPAMPWRQSVTVVENKTLKVNAGLKATIGGGGGTIQVLSNVEGAQVYLDGKLMGTVPMQVKQIKPGEHVVEVKAKGYITREKRVKVQQGSAEVLKLDMQAEASVSKNGTLKVVSPVPLAEVYLDGALLGKVPQSKETPPGEHFVVVKKAGFKDFKLKVVIESGQIKTITADLKAVGSIRFLSGAIMGAEVWLDGKVVGKTPFTLKDVDAGAHEISVRFPEHFHYTKTINVQGNKLTVVSAQLTKIDRGPTPADLKREQRGLTAFGAVPLPKGRSTMSIGAGYPYFVDGNIMVGAGELGGMGFDAGVLFRSFFSRSELGLVGRLNLAKSDPFSAGVFTSVGGGANFFDDTKRNSFFWDLGLAASLTGPGNVTVTGRAYLNIFSDRHCPSQSTAGTFDEGDPTTMCAAYNDGTLSAEARERVDALIDNVDSAGGTKDPTALFNRETRVRGMLSVIVEIAVRQRYNIWLIAEGAPFQVERAAYTDKFNKALFSEDISTYFRAGITYKF